MQHPLTVEAGQTINNVRIVLAPDPAQARIQLINAAGKPVPARALAVIPVDQSRQSFESQRIMAVTDADGMAPFSGAPGDYFVIVAGRDDAWPPNQEGLRAAAATATRIKLKAGDNKIVTVTVR
jgi:hypothetical protein